MLSLSGFELYSRWVPLLIEVTTMGELSLGQPKAGRLIDVPFAVLFYNYFDFEGDRLMEFQL